MKKNTVLLADDHALVRAGLRQLLLEFNTYDIVAEAGDGLQAIEEARLHQPDIVVLDLAMPKMRGIEAIKEIKKAAPDTKILVLSMYESEEYIRHALLNGADGYLLKGSAADELHAALEHVLANRLYLSPAISRSFVTDLLNKNRDHEQEMGGELSEREWGVLKLLAEGHSNKEIAGLLHISSKTVETHRSRIMLKLGLNNLADLVKYAIRKGLVDV
jgi:DNA-binding NarL/FixJ family response regulator